MKFLISILCLLMIHMHSIGQITGIKISGDTCSNFTLDLEAEGTSNSPYFFWHFNDPASGTNDSITITGLSASPFPTHTFTAPGVYNVCVSFQEPGSSVSTICRTISIGLCCDGVINSTDSCLQNSIFFSINTGASINSINWNFGDIASGINNTSIAFNPSHQFTSVGNYTVIATIDATCGSYTDTANVSIINCNSSPCTGSISIIDSCSSSQARFQLNSIYPIISVEWNFNDPSSGSLNTSTSINANHQYTNSGTYNVRAIVNFNCGTDTLYKTIEIINCDIIDIPTCSISIPNAFSPNNDNVNDFFIPLFTCPFEKYELLIFNRWGQQIFKSNNPEEPWTGDNKGVECALGVYGYLLKFKYPNNSSEIRKGNITLIK